MLVGVDSVQLSVGSFTQLSLRMPEVSGQFLACHRLPSAVGGEGKRKGVCYDVVQGVNCAAAGDVLDVDDLLFWFGQRVGLKSPNGFEVVSKCAGSGHKPALRFLIDALPPEIEKHQPVLERREPFLNLGLKRASGEVFRVF